MKMRGEVFSGVLRGAPLIEKYYPRLVGLVGFKPFKGTMDVKLDRSMDIRPFATKTMDHVLIDGRRKITAYLVPVKIKKIYLVYSLIDIHDEERRIIENVEALRKNAKAKLSMNDLSEIEEPLYECWAVQFENGLYGKDTVELIAPDMIKEKLDLDDGDKIEIIFIETTVKKKVRPKLVHGKTFTTDQHNI
ncbi:MAG: DUF120 domain-containing protein [Candidatus Aenigmatarchaeota archaeon]